MNDVDAKYSPAQSASPRSAAILIHPRNAEHYLSRDEAQLRSIPRSTLPPGSDLVRELGVLLPDTQPFKSAFTRAVESGVGFRLVADVGIVEIRRGEEELGFFKIEVSQLAPGRWELIAAREYLRRAVTSPLGTLVGQLPRQLGSNGRRAVSLTPQLRPTASQLSFLLGLDVSGSLELGVQKFPGGVELLLQNGKKAATLAWSYPHRVVLDLQIEHSGPRAA